MHSWRAALYRWIADLFVIWIRLNAFVVVDYTYIDVNLALNKPTSQSSAAGSNYVVDGNSGTGMCTQPYYVHPWCAVDLVEPYDIGHVTVTSYPSSSWGNYCRIYCTVIIIIITLPRPGNRHNIHENNDHFAPRTKFPWTQSPILVQNLAPVQKSLRQCHCLI